jgi:hypothetical protein
VAAANEPPAPASSDRHGRGRDREVPLRARVGQRHADPAVALAERADVIRAASIPVYVMRLHGVGPAGERTIGEYTLVHTVWPAG